MWSFVYFINTRSCLCVQHYSCNLFTLFPVKAVQQFKTSLSWPKAQEIQSCHSDSQTSPPTGYLWNTQLTSTYISWSINLLLVCSRVTPSADKHKQFLRSQDNHLLHITRSYLNLSFFVRRWCVCVCVCCCLYPGFNLLFYHAVQHVQWFLYGMVRYTKMNKMMYGTPPEHQFGFSV